MCTKCYFVQLKKKRTRLRVTCDHNRIIYKIKDTALSCRLFTYFKNSSKELFILLQKKIRNYERIQSKANNIMKLEFQVANYQSGSKKKLEYYKKKYYYFHYFSLDDSIQT